MEIGHAAEENSNNKAKKLNKKMCGIAGIISLNKNEITKQRLKTMTDVIAHRGPDGEGQWISENGNVGLGHRRLSIIDLSHYADQPMHYMGRYTIVFNGEIYNYLELKNTLLKKGYSFKTKSDTEVLMALYDKEKENSLQFLDGMFSFAIYDSELNEIFVARDRFGEKPFFYSYKSGEYFLFASEMKSLWAGGIEKKVNNLMLFNYISKGYLQDPDDQAKTFFDNCSRLPHSHYLKLSLNDLSISIKRYYDINKNAIDFTITEAQAKEKFHDLFYTSVNRRLRSDVPVGSSLSGGLDSSLVVCVIDELKKGTTQRQETFSAVFPGFEKDERKYMDYVIAKTNVSPHFVTPDDEGMIKELEKLCWHQEEPFGGGSIYVQYCVMRLAKEKKVPVLLDGQGADEILAGYPMYVSTFFRDLELHYKGHYKDEINHYKKLNLTNHANSVFSKDAEYYVRKWFPDYIYNLKKLKTNIEHKKDKVINNDFFNSHISGLYKGNSEAGNSLNNALYRSTMGGDLQTLLRYADRNSMANSREVRLPFLYHELVDFLFTLPPYFKIHNGWTKWIMREASTNVLPETIQWRLDKIGYEPPQKKWFENPLLTEKMIESRKTLVSAGILDKNILNKIPKGNVATEKSDKSWEHLMAANLLKHSI
ncbi:MAG: asparagine synthase (glutamine-hydrolyzing) [Ginsengibacter sp.]